jgi:uncharacterized protein YbaP (TraB family)
MTRLATLFRAACLAVLPLPALALCDGPDFISQMAADDRAALYKEAGEVSFAQGLYYSANRDGRILHIMGTMHLPDPRHTRMLALAAPQLATSGLLLVEATAADQIEMQRYMADNPDLMTLPDNATLPELLDPPVWEAIAEASVARGLPPFMAARMQPWFLTLTLAMPPCAMTAMMSGEGGLDNLLMEAAENQNIPTAALEPWRDMFALLTMGTFDEQVDALRLSLLAPDMQDALIVSLVDAYFEGKVALSWLVARYSADLVPDMDQATFNALLDEVEAKLLVERNHNWMAVIEAASAVHEEVFLAFGAAHLIGEDGVLHLLEQSGWQISKRH